MTGLRKAGNSLCVVGAFLLLALAAKAAFRVDYFAEAKEKVDRVIYEFEDRVVQHRF